ncbi:MAG: hypothetical protein K2H60_05770 [Muribaculaceae bacterium]|nr:hypothetical protein [Muribaculaceae bacterium]
MDNQTLKVLIDKIVSDDSLSIDERIEKVLELYQEGHINHQQGESEDEIQDREQQSTDKICEKEEHADELNPEQEIIIFKSLIELIRQSDTPSDYYNELLQLYSYLAAAYSDMRQYRPIEDIADDVLDLMRHNELSWDIMEEPVAEIMDVLDDTVYNHDLYEMLILYLNAANNAGELNESMKGWIRKMLKLRILLEDGRWCDYLLKTDLKSAIVKLMTSEELLKIILSPEISGRKKDPIEYTTKWEDIYYDVEDELDRRFANAPKGRGFCFHYWNAKKELLKDKYDIDWRSPSQMNPRIKFD